MSSDRIWLDKSSFFQQNSKIYSNICYIVQQLNINSNEEGMVREQRSKAEQCRNVEIQEARNPETQLSFHVIFVNALFVIESLFVKSSNVGEPQPEPEPVLEPKKCFTLLKNFISQRYV